MLNGGLVVEDVELGSGKVAKRGCRLQMRYVGRLASNNKVFDSSGGRPFAFKLGAGEVIQGARERESVCVCGRVVLRVFLKKNIL